MKNTLLFALLTLALGLTAHAATELETIRAQMNDAKIGQTLVPSQIKGQYTGTCYEDQSSTSEILLVGPLVNTSGSKANIAISSLQVYGETLPAGILPSAGLLKDVVKNGLSGADNNIGRLAAGEDFKYLYTSDLKNNVLTVSVGRDYGCSGNNFCNPPILTGCEYGYNNKGILQYANCVRDNDQHAFKKISATTLISHRTADAVGEPANSFSFYLRPVSTFCKWEKQ